MNTCHKYVQVPYDIGEGHRVYQLKRVRVKFYAPQHCVITYNDYAFNFVDVALDKTL